MFSARSFLIIFFVINCFIMIVCSRMSDDSSKESLNEDKRSSEELDSKHFEVVNKSDLSQTAQPTSSTEDNFKCYCELRKECLTKCLDNDQKSFEAMFLLTASEVVLGTVIVMGLSALITVLLRVCSRPRFPRNRQNVAASPDEFGRRDTRVSLSSLQQRIMSKLRDRPPRYETRHNYEYQRRDTSTRIPVLNPASNIPPPAYETNDNNSVHELPPAYTIAIEDEGIEGVSNPSFSHGDNSARNESENTVNVNSESDINDRNRTSDSTLHI